MKNKDGKKMNLLPGFGAAIGIILLNVVGDIAEEDDGAFGVIFLLIVIGLMIWLVVKYGNLGGKKQLPKAERYVERKEKPAPLRRAFPEPEAHCVVCENTGEDHFARDKAQRVRQLDEWLKNGIIDKDEYRVLKERYEK